MARFVFATGLVVATLTLLAPAASAQPSARRLRPGPDPVQLVTPGAIPGHGSTFIASRRRHAASPTRRLTILKSEVSLHFRHSRFDVTTRRTSSGAARSRASRTRSRPSFASLSCHPHASFSLYYHESANFQTTASSGHQRGVRLLQTRTRPSHQAPQPRHAGPQARLAVRWRLDPVTCWTSTTPSRSTWSNANSDDDVFEFRIHDQTPAGLQRRVMFNPARRSGGLVFKQGRSYNVDGGMALHRELSQRPLIQRRDFRSSSVQGAHVYGGGCGPAERRLTFSSDVIARPIDLQPDWLPQDQTESTSEPSTRHRPGVRVARTGL